MQYKKVQKSSWNEPYSSFFTKRSRSKMALYRWIKMESRWNITIIIIIIIIIILQCLTRRVSVITMTNRRRKILYAYSGWYLRLYCRESRLDFYTYGDNDVISFLIHASWFSPRHVVGKTRRSVCYCDIAWIGLVGKLMIISTFP